MKRIKLSNGGKLHQNDSGDKSYFNKNGEYHREDGPAIKYSGGGGECWYLNGKNHRIGGPAMSMSNGTKVWFLNGNMHRIDGPAFESFNGDKGWFLSGKELSCTTQEQFERLLKLKVVW
jgi:hypothetical protein